jgi:predicted nucleic acid-binding protein
VKFLDANIFLRYLVPGDEAKARACFALFQRVKAGDEIVVTSEAVVTEIAYVLHSRAHYALSAEEIGVRLRPMIALRGLKLAHKRTYLRALDLWDLHPALDFEDVVTIAHMERLRLRQLLSYDTDFDRVPSVQRLEP